MDNQNFHQKSNNENSGTSFPKAVQYANEILEGKYTFDSLKGKVPDSWIDAVQGELESRGFLVLPDNTKENIQEKNISPEEISQQIDHAKEEFINETNTLVEGAVNIGIPLSKEVIDQAKQETNFDKNILEIKNEAEKSLSDLEHIESVNSNIKQELLSKVDETFTKQIARDLQRTHIENKTGKEFYLLALNEYYKHLRTADYPSDSRFDFDIDTVTIEPNQLIKRVADENGWHYRMAQTSTSANKAYARMSLNVVGNKKLVESLDKIAYRYGIYYKTPDLSGRWDERTDPITIYINNPNLTPELLEQLKQEVVHETAPYIRDNQGFGIYGDNISTGVEYGPENSLEEIQKIKQEAKQISEELYNAVSEYLMKDGKEKGSVGQIMTVKKIIAMFLNNELNNSKELEKDKNLDTESKTLENKALTLEQLENDPEFQKMYEQMVLDQYKKDFPIDFERTYESELDKELNLVPKNKNDIPILASRSITIFKNTDVFKLKEKAFEKYILSKEQYHLDDMVESFNDIYIRFSKHASTDHDKKEIEKMAEKILMNDPNFKSFYDGSMNANKETELQARIDAIGRFIDKKGKKTLGVF